MSTKMLWHKTLLCWILGTSVINSMEILSLEKCDPSKVTAINYQNLSITNKNGVPYVSLIGKSIIPTGDNVKVHVIAKWSPNNKKEKFIEILNMKGENACEMMKRYMGEFFYDFQRGAHVMQVGYCPLPAGTYQWKNFPININRLTLFVIPPGFLKVRAVFTEKPSQKVALCVKLYAKF